MSQTSVRAVDDALAIVNHEERLKAIKRLVSMFAQDPGLMGRRSYEQLRKALIFLSDGNNDTGVGARFVDHERAEASAALLKLKLIMRAKLKTDGKPVDLEPEAPESPATPKPFDPWDSIKLSNEESDDEGIQENKNTGSIRDGAPDSSGVAGNNASRLRGARVG